MKYKIYHIFLFNSHLTLTFCVNSCIDVRGGTSVC